MYSLLNNFLNSNSFDKLPKFVARKIFKIFKIFFVETNLKSLPINNHPTKIDINQSFSFLAFRIFCSTNDELSDLTQLQRWGFDVPITLRTDDPRQVKRWHSQWIKNELFYDLPTNGIVAKCNSSSTKSFLGVNSSSTNWALALTR